MSEQRCLPPSLTASWRQRRIDAGLPMFFDSWEAYRRSDQRCRQGKAKQCKRRAQRAQRQRL